MTRRTYVALAARLKAIRAYIKQTDPDASPTVLLDGVDYAAYEVADVLCEDNPRLDRERFLSDCGVQL